MSRRSAGSTDRRDAEVRELLADACTAGPLLLGAVIERRSDSGQRLRARIVETEAYTQDDPASHSFGGERNKNATMFREAGRLYVYRSYGVHWCVNVVTGPEGRGEAVLLRAAEVLEGEDEVRSLRGREGLRETELLRGPGNFTRGLGLNGEHDGITLRLGWLKEGDSPTTARLGGLDVALWLPTQPLPESSIATGWRVGIAKAIEAPRRWWVRGDPCVSRRAGGNVESEKK